jgi:uncharacterized protein YcaQ
MSRVVAKPDLSLREARRIALSASGLAAPRPKRPGPAAFSGMLARLGMVQIDSVSIFARAHYMPAFSRLGPYDTELLDKTASGKRRRLFEYWGHEASFIRVDLQPSLRWRMERARGGHGIYAGLARFGRERADFIASILHRIEVDGPLSARDLAPDDGVRRGAGGWWGWSETKHAVEWLFWAGLVTTASRRGFERVYDLTERVLPEVSAIPTPPVADAQRHLITVAARALGVATIGDLRAYWRIGPHDGAARVAELVEAGELLPVSVHGWRQPAFMAREAEASRKPKARALVSPFDPLLWERDRAERLLDFRYRIEIYTPAHKREHGYYVLPFLMGDRIAARLDLKADRARRSLLLNAAHLEENVKGDVAAAVADELALAAAWHGLESVRINCQGPLAAELASLTSSLIPAG